MVLIEADRLDVEMAMRTLLRAPYPTSLLAFGDPEALLAWLGPEAEPGVRFVVGDLESRAASINLVRSLRSRGARVAVFTSLHDPEHERLALQAGADEVVTKPFHPESYAAAFLGILERTHA